MYICLNSSVFAQHTCTVKPRWLAHTSVPRSHQKQESLWFSEHPCPFFPWFWVCLFPSSFYHIQTLCFCCQCFWIILVSLSWSPVPSTRLWLCSTLQLSELLWMGYLKPNQPSDISASVKVEYRPQKLYFFYTDTNQSYSSNNFYCLNQWLVIIFLRWWEASSLYQKALQEKLKLKPQL